MKNKFSITLKFILTFTLSSAIILSSISCKSAPKRTMQITSIYNSAYEGISSANGCILTGDYEKAKNLLDQSYQKAMSVDSYELLTSACLSYVSLNLSYNPCNIDQAMNFLSLAKEFVQFSTMSTKQNSLIALNEVRILTAAATQNTASQNSDSAVNFEKLLSTLEKNHDGIKGDLYYEAQFKCAEADIYKAKKDYAKADSFYVLAAEMYTKNRYLSEIGITWYKAAQVRSLSGKKKEALQAIDNAIFYDRSAENSLALGTDYYAKGIILLKANPSTQEKNDAEFCFRHSAAIFDSINQHELAQNSMQRVK